MCAFTQRFSDAPVTFELSKIVPLSVLLQLSSFCFPYFNAPNNPKQVGISYAVFFEKPSLSCITLHSSQPPGAGGARGTPALGCRDVGCEGHAGPTWRLGPVHPQGRFRAGSQLLGGHFAGYTDMKVMTAARKVAPAAF